jgi:hypothetical protein
MRTFDLKSAVAACAIAGIAATALPSSAQANSARYYGGYYGGYHGGGCAGCYWGPAAVAGVFGLAAGAMLASPYYGYYSAPGYYAYYGYPPYGPPARCWYDEHGHYHGDHRHACY